MLILKDSINAVKENASLDILLTYGLIIVVAALFGGFFRFLIRDTVIVV